MVGRKIFVSYKYGDSNVYPLSNGYYGTAVRHYVDHLQALLAADHINKGENDNESLASFKDSTIQTRLKDKIFDSSITIVVISPQMKEYGPETDQWIPWEIAYSLREQTRGVRLSGANAILAVVLPDRQGSYAYYLEDRQCCSTGCRTHRTDTLFQILRDNMFNAKQKVPIHCLRNDAVYSGDCSYITTVTWADFTTDHNRYLDKAVDMKDRIFNFDIVKAVK